MGGQHQSLPFIQDRTQQVEDQIAGAVIKCAGWFIGNDHRGLAEHCQRYGGALRLPSG